MRRTDIGTAITLDACVRIDQLGKPELFQLGDAKLFNRFILEIDRVQRAASNLVSGGIPAVHSQTYRCNEEVNMLGSNEIGKKGEYQSKRYPPTNVPKNYPAAAEPDNSCNDTGNRLPDISLARSRQGTSGPEQSKP